MHESEAYEALLHCFPLLSSLISRACMHLVPLFYACPPFMNMVYTFGKGPLGPSWPRPCPGVVGQYVPLPPAAKLTRSKGGLIAVASFLTLSKIF